MAGGITTVGQLMAGKHMPPDLWDPANPPVLDKKGLKNLLEQVATKYPERYRDISYALLQLGRQAAFTTGGNSFGLQHLRLAKTAKTRRDELRKKLQGIFDDDALDAKTREERIQMLAGDLIATQSKEILDESLAEGNPLALQVLTGARGNPMNLASLRGSDLLYVDHRDRTQPIPVLRSYSQGLSPVEYWAGTYGARKGVTDTKLATAKAGYLGKQLAQAAHRLLVTAIDRENDSESLLGLPADIADPDNEGSLLATDLGGFRKNTVLTPKVLESLRAQGIKRLLVRSPIVSGAPDGGIYARDAGVREFGGLPGIGEHAGMSAVQALAEPISQGQLCLAEGTRVRMWDGTVREIQEITEGEQVVGATSLGETLPVTVVTIFKNGRKECREYVFRQLDTKSQICGAWRLRATADHKVLQNTPTGPVLLPLGQWVTDSSATTPLVQSEPVKREATLELVDVEFIRDLCCETYDLEVDHPDHLFVLESGLIVSNSSKHAGGVAGASASAVVSGFDFIEQMLQVPKAFPGGASHSEQDGLVTKIEAAPAGGHYVWVDSTRHFVPRENEIRVNTGDTVEAGDLLSSGIPNPSEIVRHKGVGEGRRYFIHGFRQAMRDAGVKGHRRNIELLARGLINHVRLTDEIGDFGPDDVIPYSALEHRWKPRPGYENRAVKSAVGRYLERPYLHYSIGTRVTPSMLQNFSDFGIQNVDVHEQPPPFEAEMIRGAANLQHDPDWMTRMYGSGLKKTLLQGVAHGDTSDRYGTSFVPGLAYGLEYGTVGKIRSPERLSTVGKQADEAPALNPLPHPISSPYAGHYLQQLADLPEKVQEEQANTQHLPGYNLMQSPLGLAIPWQAQIPYLTEDVARMAWDRLDTAGVPKPEEGQAIGLPVPAPLSETDRAALQQLGLRDPNQVFQEFNAYVSAGQTPPRSLAAETYQLVSALAEQRPDSLSPAATWGASSPQARLGLLHNDWQSGLTQEAEMTGRQSLLDSNTWSYLQPSDESLESLTQQDSGDVVQRSLLNSVSQLSPESALTVEELRQHIADRAGDFAGYSDVMQQEELRRLAGLTSAGVPGQPASASLKDRLRSVLSLYQYLPPDVTRNDVRQRLQDDLAGLAARGRFSEQEIAEAMADPSVAKMRDRFTQQFGLEPNIVPDSLRPFSHRVDSYFEFDSSGRPIAVRSPSLPQGLAVSPLASGSDTVEQAASISPPLKSTLPDQKVWQNPELRTAWITRQIYRPDTWRLSFTVDPSTGEKVVVPEAISPESAAQFNELASHANSGRMSAEAFVRELGEAKRQHRRREAEQFLRTTWKSQGVDWDELPPSLQAKHEKAVTEFSAGGYAKTLQDFATRHTEETRADQDYQTSYKEFRKTRPALPESPPAGDFKTYRNTAWQDQTSADVRLTYPPGSPIYKAREIEFETELAPATVEPYSSILSSDYDPARARFAAGGGLPNWAEPFMQPELKEPPTAPRPELEFNPPKPLPEIPGKPTGIEQPRMPFSAPPVPPAPKVPPAISPTALGRQAGHAMSAGGFGNASIRPPATNASPLFKTPAVPSTPSLLDGASK